ncbi:peroxisomal N(1)-acetyl-spermine/spermidine oxidase-like protein 1 [Dinothrombium tinctorium]|uniref:Peroxisomal N(1)-acetyl-spermine/spermidine oxidase-like protein 1 n=1 Tax=Dinothrombium tinctorium TaxID=1965070 RepID=A0A3S4QE09_9ACAR|nr:peroxisomal N(1)-acetyl-spermine/spermidine oxidase-like protein 1 [Dinothrombium tinctorium]
MNANPTFDVIVIGAGIAGISTVYHLINEYNYKGKLALLDARARIGGRIDGMVIDDKHVELGANWIHGLINNPLYALALKYGLVNPFTKGLNLMSKEDRYVAGVMSTGEKIPFSIIENVCKTYFWIIKKAENYYEKFCGGEDLPIHEFNDSFGLFVEKEIDNYLKLKSDKEREIENAIFQQLLKRETNISGCHSMREISLKYFGAYEELPGGNLTIPYGGYTSLLFCLLNDIKNKLNNDKRDDSFALLLDHEVVKIKWSGVGNQSKQMIKVDCSNGKTFEANHVVISLPLGVLKNQASSLFEPSLPEYKLDCIKALGFNVVNKIFLEYKNRLSPQYWNPKIDELFCFWTEEQNEWFAKIYSFEKIGDRILLAWVSGEEAKIVEKLEPLEVGKTLTKWLRVFTNNPDFPEAENVFVTNWGSDRFTNGAYTYIPANSSVRDIELLSQPIYSDPGADKPQIVFAGEACHPSFFSTAHGAFITGRKAAFYLLDTDKDDVDKHDKASLDAKLNASRLEKN